MIQLKLGPERPSHHDPLGRPTIGYNAGMSPQQVWQAGHGVWRLNPSRAAGEDLLVVVSPGDDIIRAVSTITAVTGHDDRYEINGTAFLWHVLLGVHSPHPSCNPVAYLPTPPLQALASAGGSARGPHTAHAGGRPERRSRGEMPAPLEPVGELPTAVVAVLRQNRRTTRTTEWVVAG